MITQSVSLEVKKNDRIYRLNLPMDCPLGEIHDVLFQMRSYIIDRINEAQKQDAPKEQKSE
jgi:hypothetical protein